MLYKDYYSALGKLTYAVAMANGKIHKQEVTALHKMIKEQLVPTEKHVDSFGTDTAYYVEIEFDFLAEKSADPEEQYNAFLLYIENHKSAIKPDMKKRMEELAENVAKSYHGITVNEKKLLDRLHKNLAKIFA